MYPDQQKINPKYHKSNIESIKKKQQENRERKEFEENYIPRKFFIIQPSLIKSENLKMLNQN